MRAAAVLAGFWGAVWSLGGIAFGVHRLRHGGPDLDWALSRAEQLAFLRGFALWWGVAGACAGLVFAFVLAARGRGRAGRLSSRTIVGWGAIAGAAIPFVVTAASAPDIWRRADVMSLRPLLMIWASLVSLGAACAWITWILAARAPAGDESRAGVTPPAA